MAQKITDSLMRQAVAAIVRSGQRPNTYNVAAYLGVASSSVGRYLKRTGTTFTDFFPPDAVSPETLELVEGYKRTVARLERELQMERDRTDVLVKTFERALKTFVPRTLFQKGTKKPSLSDETAILLLGDVQIGLAVTGGRTMGLEEYSLEIIKKRADKLLASIEAILQRLRRGYRLNTVLVCLLGDIVEGEGIYPGQLRELDLDLVGQVVEGCGVLSGVLYELSRLFESVKVVCIPGNHGRIKGRDHAQTSNMDVLSYHFMRVSLQRCENVQFFISKGRLCGFQVYGRWNFLMTHGEQIRRYLQLPYYGLDRFAAKAVQIGQIPWHYIICGHHHTYAEISASASGRIIVNGSWVGATPFTVEELGLAAPPTQVFMGLHPEVGRTWQYDIRLAEIAPLKVDERGFYTPIT